MQSVLAELKKVCRNKLFLTVLIGLLGVNLFCLYHTLGTKEYTPNEYRSVWQQILDQPEEARLAYMTEQAQKLREELIENKLYITRELLLYERLVSELLAMNGYEAYLAELGKKRELITGSVLFRNEDSFSVKSAEKTYREYQNASKPVITTAPSEGVELITLSVTDLLAVCAGLFACVVLFVREREQGMLRLQWTLKHGRQKHLWYKLCALLACSFGLAVLFYGTNYIVAMASYGFGPLGRDIRMVEAYAHSVHGFSVGAWLGISFLCKVIVLYVVLLLCSFFCTLFSGMLRVVLGFSGMLLAEFLLYTKISAISVYAPFHYVNLFAAFQSQEWLLAYKHINFLGTPVNYTVCTFLWFFVLAGLSFTGCYLGYRRYGTCLEHTTKVKERKRRTPRICTNLFGLELWKMLIMQRLLPMVLGLLVLQGAVYLGAENHGVSLEEHYYKSYLTRLEGEINENTETILNELYEEALRAQTSMAFEVYERVYARYEYLLEHGGCFVYDTGFAMLIGEAEKNRDAGLAVKLMFVLVLFCAVAYSYDPQNRMSGLLHSTTLGEKAVPRRKLFIGISFGVLAAVAVYLPDFLQIAKRYELHGYSYPAKSLPWLLQYGDKLTIGGYLALLYAVRILLCPVFVFLIMVIAERRRSFVYTFFTGVVLFLCLPLLTMLNPALQILAFPVYGMLGNPLLQGNWLLIVGYFLMVAGAVLLAFYERRRLWN